MDYKRKLLIVFMILIIPSLFIGCEKIDKLKVKCGFKNEDFEYIKQGKISKIAIQSTRDKGFRFIVEDKKAISGIYDILSSGKKTNKKSTLKPDYVFEMYENDESVHKFNYVVGIDKKNGGNLYDENNNVYLVSKRLDNDIIKNFYDITIPKNFSKVYYGSLLEVLNKYVSNLDKDETIGIDINNDVEMNKFLLSSDLEDFKSDIKSKNIKAELLEGDNKDFQVIMKITTEGYKSNLYKGIVKFLNNNNKSEKVYYIWNKYEDGNWKFNIFEDKKPKMDNKTF
ncbi:hypothetical protein ACFIJ5_16755 [Haloimpatiens sp. FM7330]|uniref:hypothetical protein n=1 Tax=Haloimpatiens sp. FM7330 TaxID=3298610 RepID=UPI003644DA9C